MQIDSSLPPSLATTHVVGRLPATDIWSLPAKVAFRFIAPFVLLFIITLPFPYNYLPDTGTLLSPMTSALAGWVAEHLFDLTTPGAGRLLSDSTGLYVHVALLGLLSTVICILWSAIDRERRNYSRALYWLTAIAAYYLSLHLFIYGFNKVFKWQFYLPEPNTLFTTIGETPRDLLYWTAMGTSRAYSIFTGSMEVIAAALLLFRRTRLLGALLAIGLLINIVAINLSFDISVKIHASFLLLLSFIVAAPNGKRLVGFFFRHLSENPIHPSPLHGTPGRGRLYIVAKTAIIAFILFDVLSIYAASGNFNDDAAPRPPLHGAYEVIGLRTDSGNVHGSDTRTTWKRAFVHRRGYFIVQTLDDRMYDYRLTVDTGARRMTITDYAGDGSKSVLRYEKSEEEGLRLRGTFESEPIDERLKKVDLGRLPLLREEFHWVVD